MKPIKITAFNQVGPGYAAIRKGPSLRGDGCRIIFGKDIPNTSTANFEGRSIIIMNKKRIYKGQGCNCRYRDYYKIPEKRAINLVLGLEDVNRFFKSFL